MMTRPVVPIKAQLLFEGGRCTGIVVEAKPDQRERYTLGALGGLLSITDRMILDQLAARVDKLARQLEGGAS